MATKDLNQYIRKSHIAAVEKFKAELERYIRWHRLNLAVVRKRNAQHCPKLW